MVATLMSMPGYEVSLFSYRHATSVFERHGVSSTVLDESTTEQDFAKQLSATAADGVLAATSVNGVDLEKRLIAAANLIGLPSLSVLDFWSNYRARFFDTQTQRFCLPTRIVVPDDRAKLEMMADGIPKYVIIVTGQPAFDRLMGWTAEKRAICRSEVRSELGLRSSDRLLVFASQPLTELYGGEQACLQELGYTEETVFSVVQKSTQICRLKSSDSITTVVCPHPREAVESWQLRMRDPSICPNPIPRSTLELAIASNLLVGMTSIVLLEASLVGVHVLSIQGNENKWQRFVSAPAIEFCDMANPCRCAELMHSAFGLPSKRGGGSVDKASEKVAIELRSLIESVNHKGVSND